MDYSLAETVTAMLEAQLTKCSLVALALCPRPRVYRDGDQWCAVHGEDIQSGIAGFGDKPAYAVEEYYEAYLAADAPTLADLDETPAPLRDPDEMSKAECIDELDEAMRERGIFWRTCDIGATGRPIHLYMAANRRRKLIAREYHATLILALRAAVRAVREEEDRDKTASDDVQP